MRRFWIILALAVGLIVGAGVAIKAYRAKRHLRVADLVLEIPSASAVFVQGSGFAGSAAPFGQSNRTELPRIPTGLPIDVRLPANATGRFLIRPVGSETALALALSDIRPTLLEMEESRGIYRSVLDGVDLVAVRDVGEFRLAFVISESHSLKPPSMKFEAWPGETASWIERRTGSPCVGVQGTEWFLRTRGPTTYVANTAPIRGTAELNETAVKLMAAGLPNASHAVVVAVLDVSKANLQDRPARPRASAGVEPEDHPPTNSLRGRPLTGNQIPSVVPPSQLLDALVDAGMRKELATVLKPGFDKQAQRASTPLDGHLACQSRIESCLDQHAEPDRCIENLPRCQSATPWHDDPGGYACCPESCIRFFNDAATRRGRKRAALYDLTMSHCYPGVEEYLKNP